LVLIDGQINSLYSGAFFMLKTFHFKKTALVVATSAAVLGVHLTSTAQDATLNITGQINTASCVLLVGTQSGGAYTLNLGTFTAALASAAGVGGLMNSTGQSVVFRAVNNDLTTNCTSLTTNRWDVAMDTSNLNVVSAGTRTFLTSQAISGVTVAQNVGVTFQTSTGAAVTAGTTPLNLNNNAGGGVGVFMSGSASGVLASERIALTALFGRSGASAPTAGSFSVTIPLNIWYR
jgi:hypothetical protein